MEAMSAWAKRKYHTNGARLDVAASGLWVVDARGH